MSAMVMLSPKQWGLAWIAASRLVKPRLNQANSQARTCSSIGKIKELVCG
jgi:hypothetical protein